MNLMMQLRKCCNHAFLIQGAEEREIVRLRKEHMKRPDGTVSPTVIDQEAFEREAQELLVLSSGKLVLLDKLLPRLKEDGHRVLIFSQFKIMLDIIQDYLRLRSHRCERIDGNITGNDRQSAIDRFSKPGSSAFIMLLSTRAGGVGINLTAADTVIIYDSDWNPQSDLQAQARCHRIGQKKSVKIYRLLSAKTYEQHMFHTASLKLGLDQAVLGGIRENAASNLKSKAKTGDRMSKEEIESLLKHGAYEMFREEKDGDAEAASKRFSEESIDQILSRSTTIIHDPKKSANGDSKNLMSSFSKATFVSSENPNEVVDIDDPDFWTKVIGLKGVEEQQKAVEPSPLLKRRRRRVTTYLQEQQQFEDFSDDNSAPKKGRKARKNLEAALEKEVVEIVSEASYSSSEDSEDVDTDELLDDDFSKRSAKKRNHDPNGSNESRKKLKPNFPPLHFFKELVLDILHSFGYGRWDILLKHNSGLKLAKLADLKSFTAALIASCVRVACAPTMVNEIPPGTELSLYQIYSARLQTPGTAIANLPMTASAALLENLANCVDTFGRRYSFVERVVRDANVTRLSDIFVPIELRRALPVPSKGDRAIAGKLNQIDLMTQLTHFINNKFSYVGSPLPVVVDLLIAYQRIGNAAAVQELIRAEQLPSSYSATEDPSVTGVSTSQPLTTNSTNSATLSDGDTAPEGEQVQAEPKTSASSVALPNAADNPNSLEVSTEKANDTTSNDKSAISTASKTEATINPVDNTTNEVTTVAQSVSTEEVPVVTPKASDAKDANERSTAPEDSKTEATGESTETNAVTTSSTNTTGIDLPSPAATVEPRVMVQQRAVMKRLRALQSLIDNITPPAPWWIPVVDDLLLLLHVFNGGWLRSRAITPKLSRDFIFFGPRAASYPLEAWPSVAQLNRQVKVLLKKWVNAKPASTPKPAKQLRPANGVNSIASVNQNANHANHGFNAFVPPHVPEAMMGFQPQQLSPIESKHNQFARLIFSYGIPDTRTCRSTQEQFEKWRYFVQDPLLGAANIPLESLLAEAQELERVCRERLQLHANSAGSDSTLHAEALQRQRDQVATKKSIFGGSRGYLILSPPQCRRLLHRVDLFRLLRSRVLVLPPAKLTEVVSRVIKVMIAKKAGPNYPAWWSSPRHDIMLLQGVECYGLDEHLAHVWKLPLFAQANIAIPFPNTTWVENYITSLAAYARKLLEKARQVRVEVSRAEAARAEAARRVNTTAPPIANTSTVDMTVDMTGDDDADEANEESKTSKTEPEKNEKETEALQRVRDISDMRGEDPHFTLTARLRQLVENSQASKSDESTAANVDEEKKEAASAVVNVTKSQESKGIKAAHKPSTARGLWNPPTIDDDGDDVKTSAKPLPTKTLTKSPSKTPSKSPVKTPTKTPTKAPTKTPTKTSITTSLENPTVPSPVVVAARNAATTETDRQTPTLPRARRRLTPPPPSQRKQALRSFEVIVIDDSDDSDD